MEVIIMKNKKEVLLDEIKRLRLINPDEYGVRYNDGVDEANDEVNSFFDRELIPEVPNYVAYWYEENKDNLDYNLWNYIMDWDETKTSEFKEWFNSSPLAFQTIVNMHQFGYEVEKEKRYLVKAKGIIAGNNFLNHCIPEEIWSFSSKTESTFYKTKHTRKELEESGFGEVFNSPLFEVEEV